MTQSNGVKVVNKPFEEWTLQEVKDYCASHDCWSDFGFTVKSGKCRIMDVAPCHWDLSYHRWTKQDAEVARAIKTIYPGAVSLVGKKDHPGSTVRGEDFDYDSSIPLEAICLKPGETVLLESIIREGAR